MTNEERREARYQRRREKRERLKDERVAEVGTLEEIFTYSDMFKAGRKCCNGVRWKQSTQNFEAHLFSKTAQTREAILTGTWKPGKFFRFTLTERGKERIIDAPRIADRQVHKVLAKKVMLPIYTAYMINNNGASLRGKGLQFSVRMLKNDLREHFKRYGREGYVVILDFEKFFPTASHDVILERHDRLLRDPELCAFMKIAGGLTPGSLGVPLGVELNQAEMIALPSDVDNFMKSQLRERRCGHYMDDYYLLLPPGADVEKLLREITAKAAASGMRVNMKKTRAQSLTKPFRYCKAKYTLTETGKVIVNGNRAGLYRVRRRLNNFKGKYERGEMEMENIRTSVQSFLAYYGRFESHAKWLKILRIFYTLFGFDARVTGIYRGVDRRNGVYSIPELPRAVF